MPTPTATSLFDRVDDRVVRATELSRGPWDPRACHGGPVGALVVHAVEHADDGGTEWQLARLTLELTRPVPVEAPLRVEVDVERPGRKVSLVGVRLVRVDDDAEVTRARALRIRRDAVDLPPPVDPPEVPPAPPDGVPRTVLGLGDTTHVTFARHAVEHRFVEGTNAELGAVASWVRLRYPVLGDVPITGGQVVAAAADFGNGISAVLDFERYLFINPDLTIHLARSPRSEWVGLRSRTILGDGGAGFAESTLYDRDGVIGRSAQSLLVEIR